MQQPKRQRTDETDNDDISTENVPSSPERTDSGTEDDQLLQGTKVFNDSVHGHIEIHPLLVSIIDTPEFQRLRFIKQMGMCYFVYPGASHNRFEHSLGVSYLAGELARSLQSKQKNLKITKEDILCVEIAGLCHDLGQGPFSHLFDEAFLPKVRPDYKGKHEKLSVDMFEHMLKKNNLREQFEKYKLTEGDIDFIKEQIFGVGEKKVRAVCTFLPEEGTELPRSKNELLTILKRGTQEGFLEVVNEEGERGIVSKALVEEIWSYKGRGKDKSYLYEIVANKRNGIDVDKWDYFARDSLHLGIPNPFDWKRYLRFARVLHEPDGSQICTRDKEITNLYDMFHARYTLHRRAYQHRVNKILEAMMVEALKEANDYLLFPGKDGKMKKMSESIDDMEAYSKLNDHIMWTILCTTDDKLKKSRDLVNRILTRDLYFCVGQTQLKKKIGSHETPMKLVSQLIDIENDCTEKEIFERLSGEAKKTIKQGDIIVHIANFSYGMAEKDPVEHVKFYTKYNPNNTVEISKIIQDSMALPREFSERFLRVCVKQKDPEVREWVRGAFEEWCSHKGLKAKATSKSIDEEESFHEETETSDTPVLKDQCTTVSLVEKMMITTEGGRIEIPNTCVSLEIPPAALEREQLIEIRIIPTNYQKEEALPFARNSSVVVELLPSNLKLLQPAKLILPHCLVLKKDCEWKATVYTSHHDEDNQPLWKEDIHTSSQLNKTNCVILLQSFSWKKIEVDDEIVEAKTIILYAARRPSSIGADVYIDVGYYWDLPDCQQKITLKEDILLTLSTAFYKNGHLPLKMLFVRLSSSIWTCHQDEENPKEIQFNRVIATDEGFRTFLLKRQDTSETISRSCHFKVGQESDLVDLRFPLQVPDNSSLMNIDKSVTEKRTSIVHPIGSTSTLDFVVIESVLQVLAEKIFDWKKLGRKLLLPEEELQAIDVENRKHKEAVYQMLLKWKQKNGNDASYRGLGEALKEADRKDLQDYLYNQVCYEV